VTERLPSPVGEGVSRKADGWGCPLIKTILQLNFLDLSQGNLIAPLFAELFLPEKASSIPLLCKIQDLNPQSQTLYRPF